MPPATEFRPQPRQPRLAEMVSDALRDESVTVELPDGSMLPKQEELLGEFRA